MLKKLITRCQSVFSGGAKEEENIKLIVGLGNIGPEYALSRHNVGFCVADELARRWGVAFSRRERNADCAISRAAGKKVLLIKPATFMNASGRAVASYSRYYHIAPQNIAVIQDDLDLPLGKIRIRRGGHDGGHNGIKSICAALGSNAFPRFRIGIGHPSEAATSVVEHVLTAFTGAEKAAIDAAVTRLADAVDRWLIEDIEVIMQEYNRKEQQTAAKNPD